MEKRVFTNGCFDIIHPGHIELLAKAKGLGTKLTVGLNSDDSVRKIKGFPRPFLNQDDRKAILSALKSVDEVIIFDDLNPENLIREIKPDVLVKGGDWKISEIIGADFVLENGGEVFSIPLKENYSTTSIIENIQKKVSVGNNLDRSQQDITRQNIREHIEVMEKTLDILAPQIEETADFIYEVLESKKKILICGNGGSAADSQHIAAEFTGRYEKDRTALPAIALTTDTSALTALGNDYGFEKIYSRQVEALATEGDLLIGISTSGNSPNVIAAVMKAREKNCKTLCLTGEKGKKLASLCDRALLIPSTRTSRIQETHITIAHIWCEIIDKKVIENGL